MTDDIYKKLSEKFTDEELAESYVFPSVMSEEERKELKELRLKIMNEMTKKDKILSELLSLKFTLEDLQKKRN